MKKVVVVFPRDRYFSSASGALQITLMDQKWMTVLGGADSIRYGGCLTDVPGRTGSSEAWSKTDSNHIPGRDWSNPPGCS